MTHQCECVAQVASSTWSLEFEYHYCDSHGAGELLIVDFGPKPQDDFELKFSSLSL